jgi:hypothetical protein
MAQLGARLIDSTAKQMADQFFDRFQQQFAAPAEATDARVTAAAAGAPASGTDTEYLRDAGAPGPITQHGAEGPSAAGAAHPVHRPNPRPAEVAPLEMSPLRLMLQMEPFGLPIQFWIGSVLMLVILGLMFL